MSVLLETTLGDIVIDLYYKECPFACKNFLKLSKIKYYHNSIFHEIQNNYIALTGIPVNKNLPYTRKESEFEIISKLDNKFEDSDSFNQINKKLSHFHSIKEATSIYGILGKNKYFQNEFNIKLRHNKKGLVSTANLGSNLNNSLFFITLTDNHIHQFDNKHTIFGIVAEGLEVLDKLNKVICDPSNNKPLQNIRILKAIVLDDPFPDDEILDLIPNNSPLIVKDIEYDLLEILNKENDSVNKSNGLKSMIKNNELRSKEMALNLLENNINKPNNKQNSFDTNLNKTNETNIEQSKLNDANTIFVGNLNPLTQEEGLIDIFSKLGTIINCEIIKDKFNKISKGFAFIKFKNKSNCEEAVFKMNNAIIDDRKIKVDFSYRQTNGNDIKNNEVKNIVDKENFKYIDKKSNLYFRENKENFNDYDGRNSHEYISNKEKTINFSDEKKEFDRNDKYDSKYDENIHYKSNVLKSSLISKKREKDW